ncbi:MAG TPA: zinc-dependent metalloprotease [Candidatus Eremiobacteraceae bacterium]
MKSIASIVAFAAILGLAIPANAEGQSSLGEYDSFTQSAQAQHGLFTVWRKDDHVYLELTPAQLDHDFIETIVPGTGAGGWFIVWGNTDHLPAMLVRFERIGDKVAITWPNTSFAAQNGSPAALAIARNFPQSVEGVGQITATDAKTGDVIFDASPLLQDELDFNNIINPSLNVADTPKEYRLDDSRTFFGPTKSFPNNVLIEADQTWATSAAHVLDTAPDARSVQIRVEYNFAEPPGDVDYTPRYADDRVGIYDDIYLQFDRDQQQERQLRYLIRWNMQPSDPSKRISPAKHPMIMYISNTIPVRYRASIKGAVLAWNAAFERIGISDALQVRDQPSDPNWDPDDIRYNVIRWVPEWQPSFGADSQTLYDPRTGQEFRTGILLSADSVGLANWIDNIDPVGHGGAGQSPASEEDAFVQQDRAFGAAALEVMNPLWGDRLPDWYVDDAMRSTVLHEMGHNMGMQHNFIGSEAYTAKDLQSLDFTRRYGTTSSVMEYAPLNIWPKGYGQGMYFADALGPYDYYAIRFGYAPIPGATTPDAEWPTLERWAQGWSDPKYRYASDEDVSWGDGHAADPRAQTGDLTNDSLSWCAVRFGLVHSLVSTLDSRLPRTGQPYQFERNAFQAFFRQDAALARIGENFIGGQYLSRAHRGDPGAAAPIVPVPRAEQERALALLDRFVFSPDAWNYSPVLLSHLGYSEWSGYGYVGWTGYGNLPFWAYNPPAQHDVSIVEAIGGLQQNTIDAMFKPAVLSRIERNPLESPSGPTLTLADLFDHLQATVYGDLSKGSLRDIPLLQRNLQERYAQTLATVATAPAEGTPFEAQALAREHLAALGHNVDLSLRGTSLDAATRAHLDALRARVAKALK